MRDKADREMAEIEAAVNSRIGETGLPVTVRLSLDHESKKLDVKISLSRSGTSLRQEAVQLLVLTTIRIVMEEKLAQKGEMPPAHLN